MIYPYKEHMPDIHPTAFVADNATITGDVVIGEQSSIWFSVVIRGDVAPTRIGNRVNIQDLSCLHQSPNQTLLIEDDATIGHQVTLHSAVIRKNALIGMGSIILDGAEIGEGALYWCRQSCPAGKDHSAWPSRFWPSCKSYPPFDRRRPTRYAKNTVRICSKGPIL